MFRTSNLVFDIFSIMYVACNKLMWIVAYIKFMLLGACIKLMWIMYTEKRHLHKIIIVFDMGST